MNSAVRDIIILSPIGDIDSAVLESLGRNLGRRFGLATETVVLLNNLDFALDTSRNQYHSTPILSELAGRAPARAVKVLGITRVDLFIPILTHVYGEAQLGGRACIVSTYRLYPDAIAPTITSNERLIKESVHELGHTFKLRHCPDRTCIMHYCRRIEDVDHKSNRFCRHCRVLIDDELKRAGLKEPI